MKKTARVESENGALTAEAPCGVICAHCRGCGAGRGKSVRVRFGVVLLSCTLPPACLTAGLLLGRLLFSQEWAQALSAILMLGIGFAAAEKSRGDKPNADARTHSPKGFV